MRHRAAGRGDYGHGLDIVFLSMPQVELVAVADADPARAGERLGVPPERRYADYREMPAQESLDIFRVRWCDQRRDRVVAAAESGAKATFCEKPFARTLREADEMLEACAKRGGKLAVAHQRRGDPLIATAKRLVAEELIGDAVELRGFGKQDARGGGHDLRVLGTHILDLMIYFAGKPERVQAAVGQSGREATLEDICEDDECIGLILGDRIHAFTASRMASSAISSRGRAEIASETARWASTSSELREFSPIGVGTFFITPILAGRRLLTSLRRGACRKYRRQHQRRPRFGSPPRGKPGASGERRRRPLGLGDDSRRLRDLSFWAKTFAFGEPGTPSPLRMSYSLVNSQGDDSKIRSRPRKRIGTSAKWSRRFNAVSQLGAGKDPYGESRRLVALRRRKRRHCQRFLRQKQRQPNGQRARGDKRKV